MHDGRAGRLVPIYLLHFSRPFAHARHYLGWSATLESLARRVAHHQAGTSGARLPGKARAAGITFELARVWPEADKKDERKMKRRGHARMCPICRAEIAKRAKAGEVYPRSYVSNKRSSTS